MQRARLYVNGFNLLTISKLDLNVDPEIPLPAAGITIPTWLDWTLGLSATF